jgi:hypothetical protein
MFFFLILHRHLKRRLLRLIVLLLSGILALFFCVGLLSPESGRKVAGIFASGAQILGSFVCPYLIVRFFVVKNIN